MTHPLKREQGKEIREIIKELRKQFTITETARLLNRHHATIKYYETYDPDKRDDYPYFRRPDRKTALSSNKQNDRSEP